MKGWKKVIFLLCMMPLVVTAREITVCKDCKINTIAEAVSSAGEGDIIVVKKGLYKENNIVLSRKVKIIGKDQPVIDGGFKNDVFVIKAGGTQISDLVIKNSGFSNLNEFAGVKVYASANVIISNNTFQNTFFGIYLANSAKARIVNNRIFGKATTEAASGNGIHLWKCDSVLIENNYVERHRDGIYFEFVKQSHIIKNTSRYHLRYGLHFMFSDGNSYFYNHFSQNGSGVAVMYTRNIEMKNNIFESNWGPASYGLLLKDITNSTVSNNTFRRNTTGIYMEGSNRIHMFRNSFENNGWALKVMANCSEDTLYHNNFIANSFDISTNGTSNQNYFLENYWDKYEGYDLDKNGLGDIPYRPVSLFSMLVEQVPGSIVLLRSFMVDLLDRVEKVMPAFIPETLTDVKPMMKQIK